jgi:hypothetical protein
MAKWSFSSTKHKKGERMCKIPAFGATGPIAVNAGIGPTAPLGVLHVLLPSRLSGEVLYGQTVLQQYQALEG